jgi:crotonobetainyl-CoA:carnitine CoA-transferase CaiB-like acyl-CoA transferase
MLLDGVRVLDLTQYLSGPTATLLLAGLGADVIKVEVAPGGDPCRLLPIVKDGRSSYYVQQNRGKRSVCVDLRQEAGNQLVADLAANCDVVVENFGPGVLAKRGLDYEHLSARNPRLVMATISAFGRTGPLAHLPGYDLIGQAYAGTVALTGVADGPPIAAGTPIADCSSGVLAFAAIGHALFNRERTGEGQYIDVSMVESVFHMNPFAIQGPSVTGGKARLRRNGRHFGSVPPAGTYRGPEGWVVLQVLDLQWPRLCEAAADIDLAADERFATAEGRARHRHELVDVLEQWMQTFPSDRALLDHLETHRVPSAPVVDPADAHEYPYFRERGAVREVADPVFGTVRVPGFPLHLSGQPDREVEPPAPFLGEHNAEVLREVLGYDDERIGKLVAAGVLMASDRA